MADALKIIGVIVVAVFALVMFVANENQVNELTPAKPGWNQTTTQDCEEDEPCWDCDTMGNQECGSTTLPDYIQEA